MLLMLHLFPSFWYFIEKASIENVENVIDNRHSIVNHVNARTRRRRVHHRTASSSGCRSSASSPNSHILKSGLVIHRKPCLLGHLRLNSC
mmetsp:Transcript_9321/g.26625  ORF Transcript_9321/g.26625 Transcript_9321/m.26625 type:complete len:90 (+) Transcript_9321:109-378(+)